MGAPIALDAFGAAMGPARIRYRIVPGKATGANGRYRVVDDSAGLTTSQPSSRSEEWSRLTAACRDARVRYIKTLRQRMRSIARVSGESAGFSSARLSSAKVTIDLMAG